MVLACLAPELDHRYERLYAYLHDDMSRRQPTIGLVLDLFGNDLEDKVFDRRSFSPTAPLDPASAGAVRRGAQARSARSRASCSATMISTTSSGARWSSPSLAPPSMTWWPPKRCGSSCRGSSSTLASTAEATWCCTCRDRTGWASRPPPQPAPWHWAPTCWWSTVDGSPVEARSTSSSRSRLIDREARLQGALLYWKDFDALLDEDRRAHLAALLAMLEAHPGPDLPGRGRAVGAGRRSGRGRLRATGAPAARLRRTLGAVADLPCCETTSASRRSPARSG